MTLGTIASIVFASAIVTDMMSPEQRMFSSSNREFQPVIKDLNSEKSPIVIVRQTHELLGLFYKGILPESGLAKDYFGGYTLFYLKHAEEGLDALFDTKDLSLPDIDSGIEEAARHAFVVFANLPDNLKSRFFPNGFSRKGMLRAPETRRDFLKRIRELQTGIWRIMEGEMVPGTILEAQPSFLRTYGFFAVGSRLPIKISEDVRRIEEEKLNRLLAGIDTSL